ncbi:mastermind-like protein 1 isoform X1 [Dunckerocampus dactyliophorus]|uniref:mastermind-like protein 1 isoform X1 n=2 Tax=Dunckerocampus dactyliophorus TaxID=161453 RepID=UPI00240640EC|nr:mastermind-like protein 1 isoform X1 [Dunckerocampus dactyliophorus]XP_054648399.1 mastermind-like protein 1 isoform X1 [Dunckerocampus dactyliophorus]
MMADFVTPRHSAVMERLRRRIELFRQHHNSCERRYESATLERLELERQQTFALHQRCLQAKAKRSNKHRQPPAAGEQAGQRAPGGGGGAGGGGTGGGGGGGGGVELGDGVGAPEQSRNSTLIALQETVKRKLESAGSPLGRDQVNGFADGFPPSKKACMDATANGSPMDSKLGISDSLKTNGTHGPAGESADGNKEAGSEFQRKEMKQEPDDILPIMPPSGGGGNNSLLPDLNLNEQEWTELMEELNRTVAYEDIQDILNDGFEDRKDPLEMTPNPGSTGGTGGGGGGGGGAQATQNLLSLDLGSVKAEFSPASSAFDQDSRTGSPHVRSTSSGPPPPHPTSSPVATSSASSPAVPLSQQAPAPRQHQPPPNHLLPPGPPVPKDLSPAQQLQQLAAQQQRAQHLHSQLQHKQPQAGAKFHSQGPHAHPSSWTQIAKPSQSPLGGAFSMDKPTSPSLYPQDFNSNAQKQLLISGQPTKSSPKAGANSYMPVGGGHPNMLGHPAQGPPLNHPPAPAAQAQAAILNYNNTKPLSHFEAGPGHPRAPINQNQNKAALLTLLRQQQQQQQQQMKQKNNMNFRQHLSHSQDQNSYPAPPQGPNPSNTMVSTPGNNGLPTQPGANAMAGNHGNTAYLNSQAAVAAALKQQQHQQQILEQQKQQQYLQRQQLMAEQEKQRQQDQQLQRHLTRPPPQYQDQPGQQANQNAFPQPPVSQFTASSQPMASVASMGGPAPGPQRMFPQNQGMMTMNMTQSGGPAGGVAPPSAANQPDISLPSCGGGGAGVDVQQVLYNNMNLHTGHPPQQRQPMGSMSTPYRQNLLAQQQQHLKAQPNAAILKQQQLATARMPGSMQATMGANMATSMPGTMQGTQNAVWQQQLANQPPSSNTGLPPNAFTNPPNAFHMQQSRIPKMAPGAAAFSANPGGRPMGAMMQTSMPVAQQRAAPNPQSLGQPMANQQQAAQNQNVLPDLVAFGPTQSNGRQGLPCNQGYQVSRTANQQQLSFGYNAAAGSFAAESDLVDSLLKGQSTQEWMADLDELLASHH